MIYYATDTNTRTKTYALFMFLAITVQSILNSAFSLFQSQLIFVDISSLSSFAIFSLMFWIYDNYIWNIRYGSIRLSNIPDFSGEWIGYIVERQEYTKHGGMYVAKNQELIAVHLYISQSFRKISIRLRSMPSGHSTKSRESECTSAGVSAQDFQRPKLTYTWRRSGLEGSGEFLQKNDGKNNWLEGHYQSNYPRSGIMRLLRREANSNWHCAKVHLIYDRDGKPYLGVNIPESFILPGLVAMKQFLDDAEYTAFRQQQNTRDGGGFHMTILDPWEFETKCGDHLKDHIDETWLWINLLGLGRQTIAANSVYYCVLNCPEAQVLRHKCGLGNKDMHVTLGFKTHDLHDVPKGENTMIVPISI